MLQYRDFFFLTGSMKQKVSGQQSVGSGSKVRTVSWWAAGSGIYRPQ